jgi:hypothetical protein
MKNFGTEDSVGECFGGSVELVVELLNQGILKGEVSLYH